MLIEVREFTQAGRASFRALWGQEQVGDIPKKSKKLSENATLSEPTGAHLEIDLPANKLSLAMALRSSFLSVGDRFSDGIPQGVWDWLAARLMSDLLESEGKKMTKSSEAWVVTHDTWTAYRHRIAGPYFTLLSHLDNPAAAMSVLCSGASQHPEVNEQLLASRRISGSVGVELATALYYDPDSEGLRVGSGGDGPGSVRRLSAFLNQIAVTVDYKRMSVEEILALLPNEFARFTKALTR
ncbi:hypothetical protein N9K78_02830 [Aquiluna sp.]|nr:hypothetical protein [Aquiluna sp.]